MSANAEYQALERIITADKRFRRFMYVLAVLATAAALAFIVNLSNSSTEKARVAVAKAAAGNNLTTTTIARENIRYTTCILLVTVEQRQDPDIQQRCFDLADLPGGLKREDFSPFILEALGAYQGGTLGEEGVTQGQSGGVSMSSPQPTLVLSPSQPNNSQQGMSPVVTPPQAPETPEPSILSRVLDMLNPFN